MIWINLIRVLTSLILTSGILIGIGFIVVQYLTNPFANLPPRPTFSEERTGSQITGKSSTPQLSPSPEVAQTAQSILSVEPSPIEDNKTRSLARITWPEGVILRDNPSKNARRIGGVTYNQTVILLETSLDGQWQRVQVEQSGEQGWLKGNNLEPVD